MSAADPRDERRVGRTVRGRRAGRVPPTPAGTFSTARALAALRCDARVQLRHGFPAALLFVAVVYVAFLHVLPVGARVIALPAVLLSETAVLGYLFAGTLVHLERSDGTLDALAVTPLTAAEYLCGRVLSLTALITAIAVLIAIAALGAGINVPLLALAASLATGMFVAAGAAVGTRITALDRFAVTGGLGTSVLGLPVLPLFGVAESPLWYLFPTTPLLALLAAATGRAATPGAVALDLTLSLLWCAGVLLLAVQWTARHGFGRRVAGEPSTSARRAR